MSFNIPINQVDPTAPTPQNTPLTHAPIAQGLSRPTVPDITEDAEAEEEETAGTIQQAMLGLVHGKLSGLVGKSSGYVESLPVEVKKNIEALKGVQVKQVELQNQYKRECLELEKKVCFLFSVEFCICLGRGARGERLSEVERLSVRSYPAWSMDIRSPSSPLLSGSDLFIVIWRVLSEPHRERESTVPSLSDSLASGSLFPGTMSSSRTRCIGDFIHRFGVSSSCLSGASILASDCQPDCMAWSVRPATSSPCCLAALMFFLARRLPEIGRCLPMAAIGETRSVPNCASYRRTDWLRTGSTRSGRQPSALPPAVVYNSRRTLSRTAVSGRRVGRDRPLYHIYLFRLCICL